MRPLGFTPGDSDKCWFVALPGTGFTPHRKELYPPRSHKHQLDGFLWLLRSFWAPGQAGLDHSVWHLMSLAKGHGDGQGPTGEGLEAILPAGKGVGRPSSLPLAVVRAGSPFHRGAQAREGRLVGGWRSHVENAPTCPAGGLQGWGVSLAPDLPLGPQRGAGVSPQACYPSGQKMKCLSFSQAPLAGWRAFWWQRWRAL